MAMIRKLFQFAKAHFVNLCIGILIVLLLNPTAKAWTIRQLMRTGLFNAEISQAKTQLTLTHQLKFTDSSSKQVELAQFSGKVVFVNFWASWCPPCRAEFPSMNSLYKRYKNHPDVVFVFLNLDQNEHAGEAYLKEEGFDFPFYRLTGSVDPQLFEGTLPTTVILDKQGRIRYKHEGFAKYDGEDFFNQMDQLLRPTSSR